MTKAGFLFAAALLASAFILQGCRSSMLVCDRGDVPVSADIGTSTARYRLASVNGMELTHLDIRLHASAAGVFSSGEDAMPVDVVVSCKSDCRDHGLYNVLAYLSLSVLPFCVEEERTYTVTVRAFGVEETRKFSLFCRELSTYLPNPLACLPTSFGYERFKLSQDAVDRIPSGVSFNLDRFDTAKELVALSVVSALGKLPYDAWRLETLRQREALRREKLRQREIAECDAAEKGWRNEEALREFAVREAPALWNTVQTLRGEIAHRRKLLATLRTNLEEFGRDPASDPGFQALVEKCESLRAPLARIFTKLENAYIAYRKFEASPGQTANRRLMRKALEDGIQEAEIVSKRYLEMRKRKQNGK